MRQFGVNKEQYKSGNFPFKKPIKDSSQTAYVDCIGSRSLEWIGVIAVTVVNVQGGPKSKPLSIIIIKSY